MLTDQRRQRRPVALHRFLTWSDERFEATASRRVVLPRSILAHMEAKKVETCCPLCLFKRMCNAGFLLVQLQSDVLQPCLRQVVTLFDNRAIPVEDDPIVRVSDDLGLPMELTAGGFQVPSRPGWEVSADELFESVQGDVRYQRRQDTALGRSGRRCGKHAMVEHPGLEPRFYQPVQGREGLDLVEEGVLVDAVVGREKPRLPLCFSPQVKPGVRISRTLCVRTHKVRNVAFRVMWRSRRAGA